ncbi:MAG: VCBS repeat-containing protein, partial [Spirochaetaceae bacterium]|nr:VCBS repeat-containing protein [Spirochaetaceae bacterium]
MTIAAALCAALCAAPAVLAAPPLQFSEVGVRVGLGREHPGVFSAPPHAPGGVAGDFDGDGAQDLFYATGGGAPDRLFINRRDGTFIDRAVPAGLARVHRAHGAAAADFDGDGSLDLFIPSAGPEEPGLPPPGHLLLYRGNGDGTFTCCAPYRDPDGRLDRGAGGMAAAFGDYDLDGDLDLFVGNWASGIRGNVLFRND